MQLDFFKQAMSDICAHSLVPSERPLHWTLIANPGAGGFANHLKLNEHTRTLNEYRQKALENPQRDISGSGFFLTEAKGSALKITQDIIKLAKKNTEPFYLVIISGGNGTNLEALSAIYAAPESVRSNIAVLRLPMGTGNDGADHSTLAGALDFLIKPTQIKLVPALKIITAPGSPAGNDPFFAFNIVSIGFDAYVNHITNKMKKKLPGGSYMFWVGIASMMYDLVYKVDYIDLRMLDNQNREIISLKEKFLLVALGASGRRVYGKGTKILPDDRNVCSIKQMSLIRKLFFKNLVASGKHVGKPFALMANASRLEVTCKHPILAQMDGESLLLKPEDFPISMEVTQPMIPVLEFKEN